MNSMKLAIGAAALSLAAFSGSAFAQAPDRNSTYIESLTYGGTGCPAGSVAGNFSEDRTQFTLIFDQFVAEAGPHTTPADRRKNCQLNIDLFVPQGWSYAVAKVDFRGYVQLDPGVTATQTATYYFSNQRVQQSFDTTYVGPMDQDYLISDEAYVESLVWSRCGEVRPANINTSVSVNNRRNPNGIGVMTTDSIDGSIEQIYHVYWRRCS